MEYIGCPENANRLKEIQDQIVELSREATAIAREFVYEEEREWLEEDRNSVIDGELYIESRKGHTYQSVNKMIDDIQNTGMWWLES